VVDYVSLSMIKKRAISALFLLAPMSLPLFGGTGRPSDGFLSFVLLLGFLLGILAILHLIDQLRCWIGSLLDGLY